MGEKTGVVRRRGAVEWPTVILALVIYGGFGLFTWFHADLPVWLWAPALVWLIAWQSSLQHEVAHGHPTRIAWVNDLFGAPALWLWIPYTRYRDIHLAHHRDRHLTDPLEDPETRFLTARAWVAMGPLARAFHWSQRTVLGHVLLGPVHAMAAFWRDEIVLLARGRRAVGMGWILHLAMVAATLTWVAGVCGLSIWTYLGLCYGATAVMRIRSFAEHRPAGPVGHRSAIVEKAPVLGLLFLNNNLHAVHHARPRVAWYRLPAVYAATRDTVLADNGGFVSDGYLPILWRHLWRPLWTPVHPSGGSAAREPDLEAATLAD